MDRDKDKEDFTKDYRLIEKYLVPIAIGVIALTLLTYLAVFVDKLTFMTDVFSTKPETWGQFGDYFGGILNPILSFFTIILLIITLRISYQTLKVSKDELEKATDMLKMAKDEIIVTQDTLELSKEEVELARKATEKQVEHLKLEAKKNELARIIKEVDRDIQYILNQRATNMPRQLAYKNYFSDEVTYNTILNNYKSNDLDSNDSFNILKLCNLFTRLDEYLEILDLNFDGSPFSYHYKMKYFDTVQIITKFIDVSLELKILGKQNSLNYAIP